MLEFDDDMDTFFNEDEFAVKSVFIHNDSRKDVNVIPDYGQDYSSGAMIDTLLVPVAEVSNIEVGDTFVIDDVMYPVSSFSKINLSDKIITVRL